MIVGYTGVYNVLDYACISFPSGVAVDSTVDVSLGASYRPLTGLDKEIQAECSSTIELQIRDPG